MRQVVQSVRSGELRLIEIPVPMIEPTEVLVRTTRSVVSPGTERAVRNLAKASLLGKARARPDLVRQVVRRVRSDGVRSTMRAVRGRLDEDMPLGYSGAGVAVEVGEHVDGIRPGMRVATGGAGHGEFQVVSGNLCVPIPSGVSDDCAAFTTVGAIALQGLRQADVGIGGRIAVVGLGLVGRLAVRLAQAAGIEVIGIDVAPEPVEELRGEGVTALVEEHDETTRAVLDWSRGHGVDAVLVTAASESSAPAQRAVEILRDRGTLVIVGDVGMEFDRTPLYEKEATIRLARSYGPGRYDRSYEEWGIDYPIGHVRWTERRNLEAVLDLMASGRLDVADLITHQLSIEDVATAYEVIEGRHGSFVGVQLEYPSDPHIRRTPINVEELDRVAGSVGIGLFGAGNFARMTMVPTLESVDDLEFVSVASAGGVSARRLAERHGFARVATDPDEVINDPDVDLVMIATPHSTHADLMVRALEAGKHVFCEKPPAISIDELERVEAAHLERPEQILMIGFNRRWSPAIEAARARLDAAIPTVISYRVNAGPLPDGHWYKDRREGGRLLGEVCHFIDTCGALAGGAPADVAVMRTLAGESNLAEDLSLAIRYSNDAVAAITYATGGHPKTPKEQVEVMAGGHTLMIDDFRRVEVDGERAWSGPQDKGHEAQFKALISAIRGDEDSVRRIHASTDVGLTVMRALFEAP